MPLKCPRHLTEFEWLVQRFWLGVDIRNPEDCWLWFKAKVTDGYGTIASEGKPWAAHRLSYVIHNGEIPPGLVVMHTCDKPACVNPSHLRLGTPAENARDMTMKGRSNVAKGLTMEDARAIRADTRPQAAIARAYGVSQSMIARIKNGSRWAEK